MIFLNWKYRTLKMKINKDLANIGMHVWSQQHTNFIEFCLPMEANSNPKKHVCYNLKSP